MAESGSGGLDSISAADLTEARFLEKALQNKFQIESELGRGGFGVVFKARDLQLDRVVAIKTLHLTKSGDPQLVKRFMKEARLSAKMEHPNIVRIYTIDSIGVIHYFMMEFVEGPTIKDYLNERGLFSPFHTVKFGIDVANALAFAHDRGIIHRDIKPANVILKHEKTAVVTDFGIAKALWSEATALTTGAIGTPYYMAPEQFRGEDIDGRSDQYSMGIMLYEMLTGDVPFMAQGSMLVQQHLFNNPPPIQQRNPEVPEDLARIIMRMLSKTKEERFKDCHELIVQLTAIQTGSLPRASGNATIEMDVGGPSLHQLIEQGKQAIEQKDYDRASKILSAAKDIDPDHIDVLVMLEQVRLKRENASHIEGRIQEGIARFHDGKYTEAISAWQNALQNDSSNPEIPKFIEQAQRRKTATGRAQELKLEAVKAIEQHRFDTAIQKLKAAREMSQDDEIDQMLQKAMAANKDTHEIQGLIEEANQLRKRREFDKAVILYRRILETNPDRLTARTELDQTLKEQKRFREVVSLKDAWLEMASAGSYSRLFQDIDDSEKIYPEYSDWFKSIRAEFSNKKKDHTQILKLAAEAKELDASGDAAAAVNAWNQIQKIDPNHLVLKDKPVSHETIDSSQQITPQIAPQSAPSSVPQPSQQVVQSARPESPETLPARSGMLVWILIGIAAVVAAGFGGFVFWQKPAFLGFSQGQSTPLSTIAAESTQVPATSIPVAVTPTVPAVVYIPPTQIPSPIAPATLPPQLAPDTPVPTIERKLPPTASPVPQVPKKDPPTSKPVLPDTPKPKPPKTDSKGSEDAEIEAIGPGAQGPVIQRGVRLAEKQKSDKQYRRAIRIIHRILTADPGNEAAKRMRVEIDDILERSQGMMKTAQKLRDEGESSEAENLVKKVLEIDPYNPAALEWDR